jgi:hypothetical protein
MGGFDIYCIICGNPQNDASSQLSGNTPELKTFIKKTRYMNDITFLTKDDKIIFDCYDASDCGCFMTEGSDIEYRIPSQRSSSENSGIPIHCDCWNYIKQQYSLELKYSDIDQSVSTGYSGNYRIYGDQINQYQSRYMQFHDILENDLQELCYSPLDNLTSENEKRIQNRIKEQIITLKESSIRL